MHLINVKFHAYFITMIFFTVDFIIISSCLENVSAGNISDSYYFSMLTVGVKSDNNNQVDVANSNNESDSLNSSMNNSIGNSNSTNLKILKFLKEFINFISDLINLLKNKTNK